jgi:hypothetical protein
MWWMKDPDQHQAERLAHDALEDCGPTLTREQFGIYAWTDDKLEAAGWDAYCRIVKRPN